MNILVTGSSGFIGYHLCLNLIKDGNYVYGLDNLDNYYSAKLKKIRTKHLESLKNFSFLNNDLNESLNIPCKIDLIIHLAAQPGVRLPVNQHQKYIDSNISGFKSITDFSINNRIKNLIYASSSSVYGDSWGPSKEDSALCPKSMYALTKKFNEEYAKLISDTYGIKTLGLRFFSVYGNYGRPDMAYYKFTNKIYKNKEITLFNKGEMQRDMTHASDIILGIQAAISYMKNMPNTSDIFNLGNDHPIKTQDLVQMLESLLGKNAIISHQKTSSESIMTHACLQKSNKILGYAPKISIEEGLREFINWYKLIGKEL